MKPVETSFNRAVRATGFTLIELMVVVAIVAILAAIAYPSYQDAIRKGHRGQAKADLLELAQRAERLRTVNGSYASFSVTGVDAQSPRQGTARYRVERADDGSNANAFALRAIPQGSQAKDVRCQTLRLNQLGEKTIEGSPAPTGQATECW